VLTCCFNIGPTQIRQILVCEKLHHCPSVFKFLAQEFELTTCCLLLVTLSLYKREILSAIMNYFHKLCSAFCNTLNSTNYKFMATYLISTECGKKDGIFAGFSETARSFKINLYIFIRRLNLRGVSKSRC